MEERDRVEHLIVRSVQYSADVVSEEGMELRQYFRERHFQRALAGALNMVLAPTSLPVTARENLTVKFDTWPGIGAVDVALIEKVPVSYSGSGEVRAAFLELKWGEGTLYNCVWDLAKMATAVGGIQGGAQCGYLIAGAPVVDWAAADGAELFSSGTTTLVDLYERYPPHWQKWCKEVKTHPQFLPQLASRTLVTTVPVAVRGQAWEIRCLRVSGAAGSSRWWPVAPVEEQFGVCGICNADEAQDLSPPTVELADSPYPSDREVEIAEDHRLFDEGDAAALWRLVRNPPSWWKFIWFPGDVEFVGKTLEESWGNEPAQLLSVTRSIKTAADLEAARTAIEAFVAAHPGDPTAISAAQSYVYAERQISLSS